jgi:hypothetical protein
LPCDVGTYKLGYGNGFCKSCENKPEDSYYIGVGQSSATCAFECKSFIDPFEVNPHCENIAFASIEKIGGSLNALVVIFVYFASLIITWISLIKHSKRIRTDIGDANSLVYDGILFNSDA